MPRKVDESSIPDTQNGSMESKGGCVSVHQLLSIWKVMVQDLKTSYWTVRFRF